MKWIKYYSIILVLTIVNGVLLYKYNKSSKLNVKVAEVLKLKNNQITDAENIFKIEKQSENLHLNKEIGLVSINGDTISSGELFEKKNTIVLRYSELQCGDCVRSQIDVIQEVSRKIKGEVILITYYENRRDMFIYYNDLKNRGLNNVSMYLLPNDNLEIPIDKIDRPYFFCVNSNLRLSNFYIPNKSKLELSESYIKSVFRNLY